MNTGIIASRYADALLKYVKETGEGQVVYKQVCTLADALAASGDFVRLVESKTLLSVSEKLGLMSKALGEEKMSQSRPYSQGLRDIINHIASSHSEFRHPFMEKREVKNVGFIVIATDRGLCGGLNINLFRKVLQKMQEFEKQGIGVKVVLLGSKAAGYFNHSNIDVIASHS